MKQFRLIEQLTGPIREIRFPDGQFHFETNFNKKDSNYIQDPFAEIVARLATPSDIVRLTTFLHFLHFHGIREVDLKLGYVYGGRTDRTINGGVVIPNVVASLIQSTPMIIGKTYLFDPHSDVTAACFPNAEVFSNEDLVAGHIKLHGYDKDVTILIAPDQGAMKKTASIAKNLGIRSTFTSKERNLNDGSLSGFSLPFPAALNRMCNVIIVDDICDGGGTFVGVADIIHQFSNATVDLVVSHGIFSKGLEIYGINEITTTNSFQEFSLWGIEHFTVFDFKEFLQ